MIDTPDLLLPTTSLSTTLRIALLGPPTMMWHGQPFMIARRQARALLYRIAAAPHPVPREQLGFLLWPDSPESTARRNLTVLLTQIRSALPQPDLLVTADDAIGLDHTVVETDTAALTAFTSQATSTNQNDLFAYPLPHYRGPFLDGFSLPQSAEFEAWLSQERHVWERRYLDLLAALIERYAASGAYHAAIDAAQRALAIDEVAEDMHRQLIELYGSIGDRAAAMRQFERCAIVLERELGVEPLPETRAAFETVRDGRYEGSETKRQTSREMNSVHVPQSPKHPVSIAPQHPNVTQPHIPAPTHPLIGRSTEVAAICKMLLDDNIRMLTLCGPGGSGKTRLALQVASDIQEQFIDGVLFIPLAPIHDPKHVVDAIAQACGLHVLGATTIVEELRRHLREKHTLLILDNFEHLLPAATEIAHVLASAPKLHILITSRSLLNLSAEHTFAVTPLPLPDLVQLASIADLSAQPTVALLLARTRAHTPGFELTASNAADLAAICVRLDGLPLAIELAAARLKVLSPEALLKRLDHRLQVLDRGPRDLPDRQRTLRATIEWSYRLLDVQVQRLFEQLAVFAGGWTLEAAEEICAPDDMHHSVLDGLQTLLDSHLIAQETPHGSQPRFTMLETIREYALEQLHARGIERTTRHHHAIFFCRFAELCGPGFHSAEVGAVDKEYHNIRTALHWSIEANEQELTARIISSLFWYWDTRGLLEEAQWWLAQALSQETSTPYPWRARVRAYAGYLAYRRGMPAEGTKLATLVIDDTDAATEDRALALRVVGLAALEGEGASHARHYFERALAFAYEHALPEAIAGAKFNLGLILLIQGRLVEAEAMFWESYVPWKRQQHMRYTGVALITLSYIAVQRSEPQRGRTLLQEGLQQLIQVQETTYVLYGLLACACFATSQQRPLDAAMLFGAGTRQAADVRLTFIRGILTMTQAHIKQARDQSNPAEFDKALEQGRSLSLNEAIALAQSLL